METILRTLSTLWIYAHRDRYMHAMQAEDAKLAERESLELKQEARALIRGRRSRIAEEMRSLNAPLSWRTIVSLSAKPAVAEMPEIEHDEAVTQAA